MTRKYSEKFISSVEDGDISRTGILLAKVCLQANLPGKYVASALDVSRMTIYSWFRGKYLRDKNQEIVKDFIDILENDLIEGILPVTDLQSAKLYLQEITGKSMLDSGVVQLDKIEIEVKDITVESTTTLKISDNHKTTQVDENEKSTQSLQEDKDVLFNLAQSYLNPDLKIKAFYCYQKAAEFGHIEAQYSLASIYKSADEDYKSYFEVENVNEDDAFEKSWFWYEQAAEQGHSEAQYELGKICGGEDVILAVFWYKKAAEQGHIKAQYELGEIYKGWDHEEEASRYVFGKVYTWDDKDRAFYWYKKAADQGHIKAQYELGKIYNDGVISSEYDEDEEKSQLIAPDRDEAEFWFRQVANQYVDDYCRHNARYNLGEIYLNIYIESLLKTDFELAVFWYGGYQGYDGYDLAAYGLGEIYSKKYSESSLKTDFNLAIDWYTKAALRGYDLAQYELGEIYSNNYSESSLKTDFNLAVDWYTKAAEQKYGFADEAYKEQSELCRRRALFQLLIMLKAKASNGPINIGSKDSE